MLSSAGFAAGPGARLGEIAVPELSERQRIILKAVVVEHVAIAQPVSSESVARKLPLNLSAATVRNEMAALEEMGYLQHPHTSAGRQPSEKGYRYFVATLLDEKELAPGARLAIRRRLQPDDSTLEGWVATAAEELAAAAHNAAVVSAPRASESRLKHLELVCVHDRLILMVVVLYDGTLRQQFLSFAEATTQEDVSRIANRCNALYSGLSANQITASEDALSGSEVQVLEALLRVLRQVDQKQFADLHVQGISYILTQPEFERSDRLRSVLELLSEPKALGELFAETPAGDRPRVIIGDENAATPLRECGLVLGRYGGNSQVSGVLAVLGPMRMEYDLAISSVRYLASLLNELLGQMYGWN